MALWQSDAHADWQRALENYVNVVARQGVAALPTIDEWYRTELPRLIQARQPAFLAHEELVRLTEWKMYRGVWRAPNLVRVKKNDAALVQQKTTQAFAEIPHPTKPIATIASLDGVGPATASGCLAAIAPETYPFFDELVAAQVESLGPVAWTLGYYRRYAEALRERASRLGAGWTPAMVERALWAYVGGKTGSAAT